MQFDAIDLSSLPAPEIIPDIVYEDLLAEMKAKAIELDADLAEPLSLESTPETKILRVAAYFRMLDHAKFDARARAMLLAYATGAALDHLGAFFNVVRLELEPADPAARPPKSAVKESDDDLRRRIQLAPEGFSTAGPVGAYVFHSLRANPQVRDVAVQTPTFRRVGDGTRFELEVVDAVGLADPVPGDVAITLLGRVGDGAVSQALVDAVQAVLSPDDVRPTTDTPRVRAATIITYDVEASLTLYPGAGQEVVMAEVDRRLEETITRLHRLGHDVTRSALVAALHVPDGVQNVELTSPANDLVVAPHQAAWCTSTSVAVGGRDV